LLLLRRTSIQVHETLARMITAWQWSIDNIEKKGQTNVIWNMFHRWTVVHTLHGHTWNGELQILYSTIEESGKEHIARFNSDMIPQRIFKHQPGGRTTMDKIDSVL